jgi:hypothetical protein
MLAFFPPPPPPCGPPQENTPAPSDSPIPPAYYIDPKDKRRAWMIEIAQGAAGTLGVLGFNFQSAHNATEWIMPVSFQLACLAAAEGLRIPFAILCRTNPSRLVRGAAFAGLMAGTSITAITLYEAAVTAFAPKFAALEDASAEAKTKDAAFQVVYQAKKDAVEAAQKRVADDTTRATGASADLGKQTRVCDRKGNNCHADSQAKALDKNLTDTRADKKADRGAHDATSKELAKLDPSITADRVLVKEAAYRKAGREELFHRMASDLFGHDFSDTGLMWAKRLGIELPCLFAAAAGSLYAFCCTHIIPRPKEEKKPDDDDTIEVSDEAVLEIGRAVIETAKTLHDPEDFLTDNAATREAAPVGAADEPAPATPDKRRGRENTALDGRSRAAKEAKRKAAAEKVVKFPANKDSSS